MVKLSDACAEYFYGATGVTVMATDLVVTAKDHFDINKL